MEVAAAISRRQQGRILRVAVDGVDGAGKTTFADELAQTLRARGAVIIRASVDGFHFSKAVRYRLGHTSHEGFFLDSYNCSALKEALLDPLSPSGSGKYRTATFDLDADIPISMAEAQAPSEAILVLDGIFLHRPELRTYWDFSVFLDVAFSISIPRGAQRGPGYGSPDPLAIENRRYVEGQKLYLQTCEPKQWATLIINNDDLTMPFVTDGASSRRTTSS